MNNQETIVCAFCKGTGDNPFYRATCPVCKGERKNQVVGTFIRCPNCKGSGKKSGATLTCYFCGGLGVIPDTRMAIKQARKEIRQIQQEMEEEKQELYGKKGERQEEMDPNKFFCQSCAKETHVSSTYKVCEGCFFLYRFGEVRDEKEKEDPPPLKLRRARENEG